MSNKCPCEECICIPVCKNKRYTHLITSCSDISKYISSVSNLWYNKELGLAKHRERFIKFRNAIDSNRWFIHREHDDHGFMIRSIPEGADKHNEKYKSPV